LFQYLVWKKSLDVRYYIYVIAVIATAIVLQVFSFLLIREQEKVKTKQSEINDLEAMTLTPSIQSQIATAYDELGKRSDAFYTYLSTLIAIHIFTLGYIIQDLLMILYSSILDVYISTYTFNELINFVSAVIIIVWLIKHFTNFGHNLGEYRSELKASKIIERMENDESFNIKVTLALLLAIQYIRLVIALQVSRTFGPMVRILRSMILDISIFLLLFAAILAVFAGAGQLLFAELKEYSNLGESIKVLFATSIGEFHFETYDPLTDVDPYVGYVFVTIFVLMFNIALLNFLVAILTTTYELLNSVKNGLYLKNVISLRREYKKSPFDVILFYILPFSFYLKSKKLDEVILIIQYISFGGISIILFFVASIIMMPFTYMFILVDKIKYVPESPFLSKSDIYYRILDLIVFVFIGVPFILFWIVLDTAHFIMTLFDKNIMPLDEYDDEKSQKRNEEKVKNLYSIIYRKLTKAIKHQIKLLSLLKRQEKDLIQ